VKKEELQSMLANLQRQVEAISQFIAQRDAERINMLQELFKVQGKIELVQQMLQEEEADEGKIVKFPEASRSQGEAEEGDDEPKG